MKKFCIAFVALGAIGLTLAGCGGGFNNATSMDAAKTLIQAMTQGDRDAITKIDHSDAFSYPPDDMIDSANGSGLIGMKLDDIALKQENDQVVEATWTNKSGQKYDWKLAFNKEKDGYYFVRIVH